MIGKDNNVDDASTPLEVYAIADVPTLDFEALAAARENDAELRTMRFSRVALQLLKIQFFIAHVRFGVIYSQKPHVLLSPRYFVDKCLALSTTLRTQVTGNPSKLFS